LAANNITFSGFKITPNTQNQGSPIHGSTSGTQITDNVIEDLNDYYNTGNGISLEGSNLVISENKIVDFGKMSFISCTGSTR